MKKYNALKSKFFLSLNSVDILTSSEFSGMSTTLYNFKNKQDGIDKMWSCGYTFNYIS